MEGLDLIREKIRKRDNYTCQRCFRKWKKDTRRFDVHHLDKKMENTKSYTYDSNNLDKIITLCHKCHLSLPHLKNKFRSSSAILTNPKVRKKAMEAIQKRKLIMKQRNDKIIYLYQSGISKLNIRRQFKLRYARLRQILKSAVDN